MNDEDKTTDLDFQYDIFLSHNSNDKPIVRQIARILEENNLRVWYDEWSIKPGDDIFFKIQGGLDQSKILLLCMSSNAFDSNWVGLEQSTAVFRDPINSERRFVPILLEDCEIPSTIKRISYIDYRHREADQLLKILALFERNPSSESSNIFIESLPKVSQLEHSLINIPKFVNERCTLKCKDSMTSMLHMRPASYITNFCNRFPNTRFSLTSQTLEGNKSVSKSANPKNIMNLVMASFVHEEDLQIQTSGSCRQMAADLLKVILENLESYADNVDEGKKRIGALVDEQFNSDNYDIRELEENFVENPKELPSSGGEQRSTAIINDRLHNLSLPIIPMVSKFFDCRTQLSFDDPDLGIFSYMIDPENDYYLDTSIMDLHIEVGTRITILTWGPNRFKANDAIKSILESLWECDDWLRKQTELEYNESLISSLIKFTSEVKSTSSSEFKVVRNPSISTLVPSRNIFINSIKSDFTKSEAIKQLTAPHLEKYYSNNPILESDFRDVLLRPDFALVHAAIERGPKISITFGVYQNGIKWSEDNPPVTLIAMVVFARDTYQTWLDYGRKISILFRSISELRNQLVHSKSSDEFRTILSQAEHQILE